MVGYTKETCKGKSNSPNKAVEQAAEEQGPREVAGQTQVRVQEGVQTTLNQKEWVIKQSNPSKGIPASEGVVPQEATRTILDNQGNEESISEPNPDQPLPNPEQPLEPNPVQPLEPSPNPEQPLEPSPMPSPDTNLEQPLESNPE